MVLFLLILDHDRDSFVSHLILVVSRLFKAGFYLDAKHTLLPFSYPGPVLACAQVVISKSYSCINTREAGFYLDAYI